MLYQISESLLKMLMLLSEEQKQMSVKRHTAALHEIFYDCLWLAMSVSGEGNTPSNKPVERVTGLWLCHRPSLAKTASIPTYYPLLKDLFLLKLEFNMFWFSCSRPSGWTSEPTKSTPRFQPWEVERYCHLRLWFTSLFKIGTICGDWIQALVRGFGSEGLVWVHLHHE